MRRSSKLLRRERKRRKPTSTVLMLLVRSLLENSNREPRKPFLKIRKLKMTCSEHPVLTLKPSELKRQRILEVLLKRFTFSRRTKTSNLVMRLLMKRMSTRTIAKMMRPVRLMRRLALMTTKTKLKVAKKMFK
jgi:hypothetical protein